MDGKYFSDTTGFVGQGCWTCGPEAWFDISPSVSSKGEASVITTMAVERFELRKREPSCIRRGLKTRIIERRVVETSVE